MKTIHTAKDQQHGQGLIPSLKGMLRTFKNQKDFINTVNWFNLLRKL